MDFANLQRMLETNDNEEDYDDADLEDELNAIITGGAQTKGGASKSNARPSQSRPVKSAPKEQTHTNVGFDSLDLKKIKISDSIDDGDDDEDIDENNEDFLAEINDIISNPSLAKKSPNVKPLIPQPDYSDEIEANHSKTAPQRKDNFQRPMVSSNIPKTNIEPSPVINNSKASPNEPIKKLSPQNTPKEQSVSTIKLENSDMNRLTSLRDEYKKAALNCKKSGDQSAALSNIKTAKQLEVLIKAYESGQNIDFNDLPPLPSHSVNNNQQPIKSAPSEPLSSPADDSEEMPEIPEMNREEEERIFGAPPVPKTVTEALDQRIAKFKSTLEEAKAENNTSKVRRLGRIVKQYETAIKDYKAGRTVEFDELPAPPGFAPIPTDQKQIPAQVLPKSTPQPSAERPQPKVPTQALPKTSPKPQTSPNKTSPQATASNAKVQPPQPAAKPPPQPPQRGQLKRASSTASKQLNYLLERQRLFKEAALESKQKGDILQAKEYLRAAKGFEPLIEATQNGLPIDVTSIPTPPQLTEDFIMVTHPESSSDNILDMEREEMYRKVEIELQNQITMCNRNREYFLQLGDVSTASKFEKYSSDSKKDHDMIVARWRSGQMVPSYKYETRSFSIVMCNTEVATDEVSLEVLKAIGIPGKSDIDTYVRVEFPFPNDNQQSGRTKTVKNSINPVYNETFKFGIDRKSRQLPRVFKRHPIKLELFSKGGFLRSDVLIGTALIKLTDFETKCTLHDSYPLTDGRKIVGGKIEARVKLREPLLAKQIEEVKEKWIIFP